MEETNYNKAGLSELGDSELDRKIASLIGNPKISKGLKNKLAELLALNTNGKKLDSNQIRKIVRASKPQDYNPLLKSGLITEADIAKYAKKNIFSKLSKLKNFKKGGAVAKKANKLKSLSNVLKIGGRVLVSTIGIWGPILVVSVIVFYFFLVAYTFRDATRKDITASIAEAGIECAFEDPIKSSADLLAIAAGNFPGLDASQNSFRCLEELIVKKVRDRVEERQAAEVAGASTLDNLCVQANKAISLNYCSLDFRTQIGESAKCNVYFSGIQVGQIVGDSALQLSERAISVCGYTNSQ